MREIIAFAGKAGSGKDYRCQQLVNTQGYKKIAFADALRKIAFATMGYSYDYALEHYDELKKTVLTTNGLTMRNIMENLGTEGIRKYDNDFWVRCMVKEIQSTPEDTNICISDLRFYNEYEGLSKFCEDNDYKFKLVFCDFHSDRYENYNSHASARLAQFLYDLGYKDGEEVKGEVMQAYIQSMREIPAKVWRFLMGEFITAEEAKRIINERTVERINDGIKRACEQGYTSCSVGNVLDLPTEVVNNILRRLKECGYILYPEAIGFTQVILGITWDDKWDKQKYLDSCKAHYKDTIPSSYEFLLECYTMFDFD